MTDGSNIPEVMYKTYGVREYQKERLLGFIFASAPILLMNLGKERSSHALSQGSPIRTV